MNFKLYQRYKFIAFPTLPANNPASWNLLIKNAMNYDAYWIFKTIEKYNEIYEMM